MLENMTKLYEQNVLELGAAADKIRRRAHGDKLFFNSNKHINPTNICKDVCKFCAFSASRKNPNPYELGIDEILSDLSCQADEITEVHIVGAHNPKMGLGYYKKLFGAIKSAYPHLHIKAMTAAEVNFLSELENMPYEAVLEEMAKSGVDSMPGGGAEIFDEKIRSYIAKGKVSSKNWLRIHELWHKMGKKSNATMLFGHVESRAHRIDHILRIKELQEKTGGFNAFIPLVYNVENNFLNVAHPVSGHEILKTIAISRMILDNVPHIKAYWVAATLNLALVAAEFGADDLDGTIQTESIISKAGAKSKSGVSKEALVAQIKDAGFLPVERDSLYNELRTY
jgi:aminodeoxyfutalosine synthase